MFLKFSGGLQVVIELKMCGSNYSLNYAAGGFNQLIHYMDNKDTALGYLIIFDARKRDFNTGIEKVITIDKYTLFSRIIDVRSTIDKIF
jgi:hypothetical protein